MTSPKGQTVRIITMLVQNRVAGLCYQMQILMIRRRALLIKNAFQGIGKRIGKMGLRRKKTGTQVCLVWYVVCSVFSLLFGMRSTLTWLIVPICVVILGVYAIISKRHKYLYPFLIITIVQQLVCMMMATIILIFSFISFDTMRQII
ncbi:hypothetical protein TELCIR_15562, partial [Teladorsagia circumcincta]